MRHLMTLIFSVCAATSIAAPKSFPYWLDNFPKSASGCHAAAALVGDNFAKATGVKPDTSRCLDENADGYDIRIRYTAEEPVKLVSTLADTLSPYQLGTHKTRVECEKDIPAMIGVFEKETGLSAAFAYCQRTATYDYQWAPRIDSFGTALHNPYAKGFFLFGAPVDFGPGQFAQTVKAAVEKLGNTVTYVRTHSRTGLGEVMIHYYAEKMQRFTTKNFSKNGEKAECLSQLPVLMQALAGRSAPIIVDFCVRNSLGEMETSVVFAGESDFLVDPSVEKFRTFKECEVARPALVAKYQNELHLPVIGGICSRGRVGESNHVVNMISTK